MALQYGWFLVQLKPNGFDRAVINLERQGIKTFMPLVVRRRRFGKRYVQKKQPLFPGYIFIGVDADVISWGSVNSTYGVAKVVMFGSQEPQRLPEQLISGLKVRCDQECCLLSPTDLKIGEQVKIISGPFVDYIVTIETIPSETRLGILFECLGGKTPAQISIENVERVFD